MNLPKMPEELTNLVSASEWEKMAESTMIGHRTAVFSYPKAIRDFIAQKIFTFEELLTFSWQELQVLCINASHVGEAAQKGIPAKKLHLFDAPQLIEILHHIDSLMIIFSSGISLEELSLFSGYQLKLVLEHPQAICEILKKFESVKDLLSLKWNWIEEMLIRPEETLHLLSYGVQWKQLENLPDWDFGWFLKHVPEIIKLLDLGVDFVTI